MKPITCPECKGDGFFLYDGGPGRFCEFSGAWLPVEIQVPCDRCHATGFIEEVSEQLSVAVADDLDLPF